MINFMCVAQNRSIYVHRQTKRFMIDKAMTKNTSYNLSLSQNGPPQ